MLAENLLAAGLGLEVASGNDAMSSHSQMRKTAKLMLQFLPGTDFITSGYSSMPRRDNMFGGGNFDAEDIDDWLVIQRDMRVDAGMIRRTRMPSSPCGDGRARRSARCSRRFGFPPVDDDEIEAAALANDSDDMPERDIVADLAAADRLLDGPLAAVDVIAALEKAGFADIAAKRAGNAEGPDRRRVSPAAAIIDRDFRVESAFTTERLCRPGDRVPSAGRGMGGDRRHSAGPRSRP